MGLDRERALAVIDSVEDTVEFTDYYGVKTYIEMLRMEADLRDIVGREAAGLEDTGNGLPAVVTVTSRIKSPASMRKKMEKRGLGTDAKTALSSTHDAVGLRVICPFISDVYRIASVIEGNPRLEIVEKKDYIANPKPSGYRSVHLIVRLDGDRYAGILAEIQVRTLAIDFWSSLEHQLNYKNGGVENSDAIRAELRRCADDVAATDLSMQTLRDVIDSAERETECA